MMGLGWGALETVFECHWLRLEVLSVVQNKAAVVEKRFTLIPKLLENLCTSGLLTITCTENCFLIDGTHTCFRRSFLNAMNLAEKVALTWEREHTQCTRVRFGVWEWAGELCSVVPSDEQNKVGVSYVESTKDIHCRQKITFKVQLGNVSRFGVIHAKALWNHFLKAANLEIVEMAKA